MKKKKKLLSLGLSLGLSASACNARQESTPPTKKEAATSSATTTPSEIPAQMAQRALASYHITSENFAQRVFYTWTTPAQIEELRKTPRLLTRSESATRGPSGFDQRLEVDLDGLSSILLTGRLTLRRFAWTNAWAAALGFQGESYGNQLLKITLKPDALIASFTPAQKTRWRVADLSQNEIPMEEAKLHPERLAAVYYEAASSSGEPLYREYVLCNESMIQTWEYATPSVIEDLTKQEDVLRKLIDWAKLETDNKKIAASFDPTVTFPGEPYTAALNDLTALADILLVQRASQAGEIMTTVGVTFEQLSAVPTPPKLIVPSCLGTHCPAPKPKPTIYHGTH